MKKISYQLNDDRQALYQYDENVNKIFDLVRKLQLKFNDLKKETKQNV